MKMRIEIDVEIPDDTAHAQDDGFGEPAVTVSALMLRVLQTNALMNGLFEVNEHTVVNTVIPDIQARGTRYGKQKS